jgi:peptidoglycan/xylan/chitin deacetylase (PgdA/CDA1 family)
MSRPKELVRRAVGGAATSSLASVWLRREFRRRVNIIYYHYVGEPVPFYSNIHGGVTLDRLDKDLADLGKRFTFAPLDRVIEGNDSKCPLLAVTFDDGFDLLSTGVGDVLEAHGVRATSFVITACLDNRNLMWRHKLHALRAMSPERDLVSAFNDAVAARGLAPVGAAGEIFAASDAWPMGTKDELADEIWASCPVPGLTTFLAQYLPYFDEAGLRQWLSRGHAIGLHTRTHPRCTRLDANEIEREIVEPAALLRQRFGLKRLWFSYPFGARLPPAAEERLIGEGVVDCALGIRGFAPRGTPAHRLERASAELGFGYNLYGRMLLGRL